MKALREYVAVVTPTQYGRLWGVIGIVVGLGGGWLLWKPPARVVEKPAPAVRQRDSSLVLERRPDQAAKPTAIVPKGGVVERIVTVTVAGKPETTTVVVHDTVPGNVPRETKQGEVQARPAVAVTCPPVTVELALVRMPDETRRVVASSRDGTVLTGVDIPVETAAPARVLHWAAGAVFDPLAGHWGAFVDRDKGPLRVGISITKGSVGLRAGLRF